ncbi:MAG TPA: response regulator [Steroidobacteraceae bacterium]|nr:response regulator [Steroidobacteraceae bacterium]
MTEPTSSTLAGTSGGDANPVAGESTHEGLPKKVLVAEDNVVSQQVARRYLEAIGCNVLVVEDGNAAVDACARQEFGLVLMDLQMPNFESDNPGLTWYVSVKAAL